MIKKHFNLQITLLVIASMIWCLQAVVILIFRNRLGTALPAQFYFNGIVGYWFHYQEKIVIPGILFLGILHIGGLLLSWFLPNFLKILPLIKISINQVTLIKKLIFCWIESLSWLICWYFFEYNQYLAVIMLVINLVYLLILISTISYFSFSKIKLTRK
ncbi:MAG: hypothetical protein LKI22_01060 [Liquorilactobacillus nagelii]|jgi:hypothetical protein|uniref:hypothetical protein n=1 Tax=Liquorilactobacillus nagelii TaxID=82688 RepID=UPI0024303144|nr:hypothetical protein [Liquorilactobacillus nagelii]MCI1632545.1 hypothetical protein [Liquorilactobacillus nagelii]